MRLSPFLIYTNMTLEEMASAIRNHVGQGLKEVDDFTYSVEQLKDEVAAMWNSLILEMSKSGIFNPHYFAQPKDNIDIALGVFPLESGHPSKRVPYIKIPMPSMTLTDSAILYLGPADLSMDFVKYYDASFNDHRYSRVIGNRPYCYVDLSGDGEGHAIVYLFGIEGSSLSKMAVRIVPNDPLQIMNEDGVFGDDEEFPAPQSIQDMIIERITRRYLIYYKSPVQPSEPNTNTDKY